MEEINPIEFPSGKDFFEIVSAAEDGCYKQSFELLPTLGKSLPDCFESLGNVLSLLYREACCFYGCPGGDHFWQKITARLVSHSLGSVRLAMVGLYDESIALTRNLAEIANLLFLFVARPELVDDWRSLDDDGRWEKYSPGKVRKAIEVKGLQSPVGKKQYGKLCGVGVHLQPSVAPQSFNTHGRPTVGAIVQEAGLMVTFNELGAIVADCAACISVLPMVGNRKAALQKEAQALMNSVGTIDLSTIEDALAKVNQSNKEVS